MQTGEQPGGKPGSWKGRRKCFKGSRYQKYTHVHIYGMICKNIYTYICVCYSVFFTPRAHSCVRSLLIKNILWQCLPTAKGFHMYDVCVCARV